MHSLANINRTQLLADCAECGPRVKITVKSKERGYYACSTAKAKHRRDYNARTRYGFSYAEMMAFKENNPCYLCGESNPDKLVIDHDHETGRVRGVLCDTHNRALGLLGEGKYLDRLREYLDNPPYQRLA